MRKRTQTTVHSESDERVAARRPLVGPIGTATELLVTYRGIHSTPTLSNKHCVTAVLLIRLLCRISPAEARLVVARSGDKLDESRH